MKTPIYISILLLVFFCTFSCTDSEKKELGIIVPISLPDPHIPGFNFPEDETVIDNWLSNNNEDSMSRHAWGLWTATMMEGYEEYNGQRLRIYQTWNTPNDIKDSLLQNGTNDITSKNIHELNELNQVKEFFSKESNLNKDSNRILGGVKYNPISANFIFTNKLFSSKVLLNLMSEGKKDIPKFPNTSVVIKPVYEIITQKDLYSGNGYYRLKAWSGPPDTAKAYPPSAWKGCIYVDINNKGKGRGLIDFGCSMRTMETTYNLSDFIYFKLDSTDIVSIKKNIPNYKDVNSGDIAILIGMHIMTREIQRWTWQTFWWAPDPDNPPLPSSKNIANNRPSQLTGAPRHYAMAHGYSFTIPNQPYSGGNNIGTSIYTYNPYIEAMFISFDFFREAIVVSTNKDTSLNNVGIRTNCMSCHALATYKYPDRDIPHYAGDTYIDMLKDSSFNNSIRLSFLWSIKNNINK